MGEDNPIITLKINTIDGGDWRLKINRNYAESLMKTFHSKIFKSGTMQIGLFDKKDKVQVFNIKHIVSMCIQTNDTKSGGEE